MKSIIAAVLLLAVLATCSYLGQQAARSWRGNVATRELRMREAEQ